MLRDSMLLVNIQLAIMGIVLVAGLFYLWRMICRVERRVDDFIATSSVQMKVFPGGSMEDEAGMDEVDDADESEQFMREVFGDMSQPPKFNNVDVVEIEEEDVPPPPPTPSVVVPPPQCVDTVSEADTTSSHPKSAKGAAYKKMNLDALRVVCKEKGLSTEGTKTALLDRILATEDA